MSITGKVIGAVALLAVVSTASAFMSAYDSDWTYTCPSNQVVQVIESRHNNRAEDRIWHLGCVPTPRGATLKRCSWSDYVNEFDKPVNFQCRPNAVIAGISSYHSNKNEDRRWKFRCCNLSSGYVTYGCSSTGYLNTMDDLLSYTAPAGKVIVGQFSYHDNKPEDRRFGLQVCTVGRLDLS